MIFEGDARDVMSLWAGEQVQCIVTSPPYFAQRDYENERQLGNEATPEEYVARMVALFREARRVLKDDGTCWIVLGDKYDSRTGQLLGMPWRVALALQANGWILRSDVIWQKPNAMPSATKNRPTTDHEYCFLLAKKKGYKYNSDAVREPHVTFSENSKMKGGRTHFGKRGGTPEKGKNEGKTNLHDGRWDQAFHPQGRNKRTVWSIPLSKYRKAHFAVFPEKLVELCVLAGSDEGDLILDPFCGSGTALSVAARLGRRFCGIDCNSDYLQLTRERLAEDQREVELILANVDDDRESQEG